MKRTLTISSTGTAIDCLSELTLNTDRLNKWLSLAANFGVLVGIFFLVIEIRQNTNALYAESRQAVLSGAQHELLMQLNNPDIHLSIIKPEPLTPQEHVRLSVFLTTSLKAKEFAWLQYQDGVIDEEQWRSEVVVIGIIFDAQRNRKWWEMLGREFFKGGFRDFVDDLIASQPATDKLWDMESRWTLEQP